ncbi:unnamed protein product [Adineta steineri]|uniref:NAD(P)(+)--arginine ADP-ribosyltransferase n=1 Tax=Adineta steineri TaxID=433720 RepID=A0A814QAI9_9BILA|nr:unnamed protein product [Adineta steineri]CAF1116604.1 unnamed protein product [Adineta steineri]CAF3840759.1 unnamed protein product [Adineta steineri]CAF4079988.1 unnamed protein product [Adineta steineri]
MGNTDSTTKEEQRILSQPQTGEASEFYWACRNGNIEKVKQLLPTISYEDLNRLESNGSTPLHAASYSGQVEIVRLLLHKRGCRRDRLNRHGLTAYEEAFSDDIRQLFHRPAGRNRFCDEDDGEQEDVEKMFQVTVKEDEKEEEEDDDSEELFEDKWLQQRATSKEIENAKIFLGTATRLTGSKLVRLLLADFDKDFSQGKLKEDLNEMLAEHVTDENPEYDKCRALVTKAFAENRPEHLLRLYSLETGFYRALADDVEPLITPLYILLEKLKPRYFQGVSYRGVKMTAEDLRSYRWALKKKGAIQTQTFCSTSLDRSVAERFAGTTNMNDEKQSVLMIFNFAEKCDTAINLNKLSNELPCLSEYENEKEVLVFPATLFYVTHIEEGTNCMTIYLKNIAVPKIGLFRALKRVYDTEKWTNDRIY